jgi:hypothetical protein
MVKQKKPAMVFLMETKIRGDEMELIQLKLGIPNMFVVDCIGKSGGLALLWDEDVTLDIQNYSQRHINGVVKLGMSGDQWKFTGFYGHSNPSKRNEAWALLKHLANFTPLPCVCLGDFNEILSPSNKWGGQGKPDSQMQSFKQTLEVCELYDLGYPTHTITPTLTPTHTPTNITISPTITISSINIIITITIYYHIIS